MEYFNFEDASKSRLEKEPSTFDQTFPELMEEGPEAQPTFDGILQDDHLSPPQKPWPPAALDKTNRLRVNNTYVEVERQPDDFGGVYPMFRAKTPCDLCRRMGMDCFISQKGALINGCTCCISLYKECSFTFAERQQRDHYLDILSKVTEDVQECNGSLVTQRALKSFSGGDESRLRKSGSRLSREALKALKGWLNDHADHPYPTDVEKERLEELTGLKRSQISNWLANARRRGKVRPNRTTASPVAGAIDIPRPANNSIDVQAMSPLERWKHSPPEHEPASAYDIARAVAENPACCPTQDSAHTSNQNSRQGSRRTSSNDSNYSMFQAPSLSSLETSRSSAASGLSSSLRSRGSFGSLDAKERRRRRRAPLAQRRAAQKPGGSRIFQCTFCADSFASKYDWQRHEKSLHLALERWICAPKGPIVEGDGGPVCAFCRAPDPTNDHLETHNFTTCQEKSLADRTFYRKDHLRQHLKLLHSTKFDSSMENWKSMMSEIKSSCGFCPAVFSTWEQRADHLAAHFKNGANMSTWADSWGFEPHIEALVENCVPPYMNANERSSMNPFVATATTPGSNDESNVTNLTLGTSAASCYYVDSNCWRRLEQVLGGYIHQQKIMGFTPTDKDLQDEARRIVFDDDDPWNQTAADNEKWLASMKYRYGIVEDAENAPKKLEEIPLLPPFAIEGGLKHGRGIGCPNERRVPDTVANICEELSRSVPALYDPISEIDFDQLNFENMDLSLDEGIVSMTATQDPQLSNSSSWQSPQPLTMDWNLQGGHLEGEGGMYGLPVMTQEDMGPLSGYLAQFPAGVDEEQKF